MSYPSHSLTLSFPSVLSLPLYLYLSPSPLSYAAQTSPKPAHKELPSPPGAALPPPHSSAAADRRRKKPHETSPKPAPIAAPAATNDDVVPYYALPSVKAAMASAVGKQAPVGSVQKVRKMDFAVH